MDNREPENGEGCKLKAEWKSMPEIKGWVRRVVEASGVAGSGERWERTMGWVIC